MKIHQTPDPDPIRGLKRGLRSCEKARKKEPEGFHKKWLREVEAAVKKRLRFKTDTVLYANLPLAFRYSSTPPDRG